MTTRMSFWRLAIIAKRRTEEANDYQSGHVGRG